MRPDGTRTRQGIDEAIDAVKRTAKEGTELAWQRVKELETEREEHAAAAATRIEELTEELGCSRPEGDGER